MLPKGIHWGFIGLAGWVCASALAAGPVEVSGAWSRATAPGAANGAAFFSIQAISDDRLVAAESPVATHAELHEHKMKDGVARMRKVSAVSLPAGRAVTLQPGGLHVMLMGLKAPLAAGGRFPLRLMFEKAGTIEVEVAIESPGAMAAKPAGHAHETRKPH